MEMARRKTLSVYDDQNLVLLTTCMHPSEKETHKAQLGKMVEGSILWTVSKPRPDDQKKKTWTALKYLSTTNMDVGKTGCSVSQLTGLAQLRWLMTSLRLPITQSHKSCILPSPLRTSRVPTSSMMLPGAQPKCTSMGSTHCTRSKRHRAAIR